MRKLSANEPLRHSAFNLLFIFVSPFISRWRLGQADIRSVSFDFKGFGFIVSCAQVDLVTVLDTWP
jgi:hypothetical protein